MKEKRNYKQFDLLSALAILGCIGMLLFESIFIFEIYDRAVEQPEIPDSTAPAVQVPAVPVPSVTPARRVPVGPADVPPAQIETAPAAVPVG